MAVRWKGIIWMCLGFVVVFDCFTRCCRTLPYFSQTLKMEWQARGFHERCQITLRHIMTTENAESDESVGERVRIGKSAARGGWWRGAKALQTPPASRRIPGPNLDALSNGAGIHSAFETMIPAARVLAKTNARTVLHKERRRVFTLG